MFAGSYPLGTSDGAETYLGLNPAGTAVQRFAKPGIGGTVTANTPFTVTQIWNNAGVNFIANKISITDTASAPSSAFVDYQVGGASKFMVGKDGGSRLGLGDTVATDKVMEIWLLAGANAEGSYIGWDNGQFGFSTVAFGTGTLSPINFSTGFTKRWSINATDLRPGADNTYDIGTATARVKETFSKDLTLSPSAARTPANNGELVIEATSNTTLTFRLKGSDGTVRSAALTLA